MKWVLLLLMACIIIPGLHYTGFITLFKDSSPAGDTKKIVSSEEKMKWSAISSPKWQAQDLNGDIFSLEELKGQIIILNFWASWCLPCHKEFPELIAATKWAKGNVHLVAVSVDSSKEDIKSFLKRYPEFPSRIKQKKKKQYMRIVWDPNYEIANQFNVVKFPETFILNRDLKIVKKYTGEFSLKEAKHFLQSLLTHKEQSKN